MNSDISLVGKLKQEARAARDFNDFGAAVGVLDRAIKILEGDLNRSGPAAVSERAAAPLDIQKELADCYGMKGGVYRRAAMNVSGLERAALLDLAEEMYTRGATFEREGSYNLTNAIVTPLIQNPGRYYELLPKAAAARDQVRRQLEEARGAEWWAWADLGLLNLLAGDAKNALHAYSQFVRAGAQDRDCQSAINVLEDLHQAWPMDEVRERFGDAIAFLQRQRTSIS